MQFDYTSYYRGCFFVPVFIAFFALLFFLSGATSCVKLVLAYKENNTVNKDETLKVILILLISLIFLIMNVGRLIHGGMYLINEKESDAVEIQGEIANIEGLGRFSFPELKSAYGYGDTNGVQFTINGIQCKASVKGDLEVGDYVTVVYLPKSGYILSISEIEDK